MWPTDQFTLDHYNKSWTSSQADSRTREAFSFDNRPDGTSDAGTHHCVTYLWTGA